MDYELAWKEMKNWLDDGMITLDKKKDIVSGRSYYRVRNKIEGLRIVQQYMDNVEKEQNGGKAKYVDYFH
jgi:hypothetical protein